MTDDSGEEARSRESTEERIIASKKMMQRLQELETQRVVFEAIVWARVFGGSMVLLGADDGQNVSEPLNEDRIRTLDWLKVLDRWQVNVFKRDKYGHPSHYTINPSAHQTVQVVEPIHASRFIRFDGPLTPKRRYDENNGWNDSVYSRVEEVLRDYGTAWGSIGHILQDFSQGVYKLKHLAEMLTSDANEGEATVLSRLAALDRCRSMVRAIPVDADDEDFERKNANVSGLPEMMDRFALRLSTATRIPVSLLLGQSPAGLQATGDSDIRFFYDSIKSQQETQLRPRLEYLLRLLWKAADGPTKGKEPENWSFEFNDLWQMTDEQLTGIRKTQAETDALYMQWDVLTPDEVAVSRFGGDAYSTDTVLDMEQRLAEADPELPGETMAEVRAISPGGNPDEVESEAAPVVDPSEALNGAQITALVQVLSAISTGELPADSAAEVIEAGFPIDRDRIERMIGPIKAAGIKAPDDDSN